MEEFRHTPIIPISEKELFKHKQKIEEKNRKGYYVEIRKDTIYFYTISLLTLGITFYTFLMVNEKQMYGVYVGCWQQEVTICINNGADRA